jgi:hypothetical protein
VLEELTFEGGMAWASRFDEKVAQEIVHHAERELDAAAEIYICRQFSRLRDSYLLKTVPEGLVSSQRLNAQLQDRPTKTGVKPGVLSLYAARCPTHFSASGTWNASRLPALMGFLYGLSQDKSYMPNKRDRELFQVSFQNPEWVLAASAFVGIKMLERQRKHGALITDFADRMLAATERVRELMQSTAAMIGRIAGGTQAAQDLQRVVQECFRVEYERFLGALDSMSTEEYRLYRRLEPVVTRLITAIPTVVSERAEVQLAG